MPVRSRRRAFTRLRAQRPHQPQHTLPDIDVRWLHPPGLLTAGPANQRHHPDLHRICERRARARPRNVTNRQRFRTQHQPQRNPSPVTDLRRLQAPRRRSGYRPGARDSTTVIIPCLAFPTTLPKPVPPRHGRSGPRMDDTVRSGAGPPRDHGPALPVHTRRGAGPHAP
jgi:hypothetical protein